MKSESSTVEILWLHLRRRFFESDCTVTSITKRLLINYVSIVDVFPKRVIVLQNPVVKLSNPRVSIVLIVVDPAGPLDGLRIGARGPSFLHDVA